MPCRDTLLLNAETGRTSWRILCCRRFSEQHSDPHRFPGLDNSILD